MKRIMAPIEQKRNLAGNYSIPDSLNKELQKEFAEDVSTPMDKLQDDIINQNNYNKKRFQRSIVLDLDEQKSYKQIMNERNLEREELRVEKLIKEKDDGTTKTVENPQERLLPRKRKKRWDVTPEEYKKQKECENNKELVKKSTSSLIIELVEGKVPVVRGIPLTDSILEKILPPGYVKVNPPAHFKQNEETLPPDLSDAVVSSNYYLPPTNESVGISTTEIPTDVPGVKGLEFFKEEDMKYFGKLVHSKPESLNDEEKKELNAMKLVLKIKNGSPVTRKRAMRQLTNNAAKFGPKVLLNQILPILLEPN